MSKMAVLNAAQGLLIVHHLLTLLLVTFLTVNLAVDKPIASVAWLSSTTPITKGTNFSLSLSLSLSRTPQPWLLSLRVSEISLISSPELEHPQNSDASRVLKSVFDSGFGSEKLNVIDMTESSSPDLEHHEIIKNRIENCSYTSFFCHYM